MSQRIKDLSKDIKDFLTSSINADMPKEQIDKYNEIIGLCDSIDEENSAQEKELHDCKEVIIKQVRSQGSSDKPKEEESEKQPRTLEQIAQDLNSEK